MLNIHAAQAGESVRLATFNIGFQKSGPGILLRDILRDDNAQILMSRDIVAAVNPDVLLLTNFDYDFRLHALSAFADKLASAGVK